ncbi:MAG: HAMP domain-containing protein [Phycisphaera sp.]|nr:HAMP domain-containing protein [Phycisphaera sp.]
MAAPATPINTPESGRKNVQPPDQRMSLHRRLWGLSALYLSAVVGMFALSLWGLFALDTQVNAALAPYRTLREVYEIGQWLSRADAAWDTGSKNARTQVVRSALTAALLRSQDLERVQPSDTLLHQFSDEIQSALGALSVNDPSAVELHLNYALNLTAQVAGRTRLEIVSINRRAREQRVRSVVSISVGLMLIMIGVVWATWRQVGRVTRPLDQLTQGVERLSKQRFGDPVPIVGDREFALLAQRFNAMSQELASLYESLESRVRRQSRELAQAERLASVGYLAAGVAHEINNPLAVIQTSAELALRTMDKTSESDRVKLEEARTALHDALDHAQRCAAVCRRLLALSRPEMDTMQPVNMRQLIDKTVELSQQVVGPMEVRVIFANGGGDDGALRVLGDEDLLRQVMLNLLANARASYDSANGARVTIVVNQTQEGRVVIDVRDEGRGMTPQTLERAFEPFFTTRKGSHQNAGLGLSLCYTLIQRHNGAMRAASDGPGKGSVLTVDLPGLTDSGQTEISVQSPSIPTPALHTRP